MSDLALKVGGTIYGGWKEIRIQRGIRRFADTFDLTLTERWAGQDVRRPVQADSPCVVEIDGETVITGYTDDVLVDYDDNSHSVSVNGRSKLGDLVDCSGEGKPWNVPMKLERVAKDLCSPFGIKVITNADTGDAFNSQKLEVGETYQQFLSRLADFRAVFLTSNANGDLVITRAGTERIATALVLGENILSASGTDSKRDRFHRYIVLGQDKGSDDAWGAAVSQIRGEAFDQHIRKERVTYIDPGDRITLNDAKRIAEYERNIRYGESQAKTYTVSGWRHADGLWEPNKMVRIIDPYQELDAWRLITHVTFILDEDGERTELEVMPREALDLIPLPEPEQDDEALI